MRIVFCGSAANPPTLAHREMGEMLTQSRRFDMAVWFPSGVRADKSNVAAADHRRIMTELTFPYEWRVRQPIPFIIDYRDINTVNTPTIELFRALRNEYPDAEIVFATGVDVFTPDEKYGGKCEVEAKWVEGEILARTESFFLIPRRSYPDPGTLYLPLNRTIAAAYPKSPASSSEVRGRIRCGLPFEELVTPEVALYIKKHDLYKEE